MTTQNLINNLETLGYFIPDRSNSGDHEPGLRLYNSDNKYLGDYLQSIGFTKTEEAEYGKTWTTYTHDSIRISHRSFSEMPDVNTFSIKY